jgi:hypothetical protein
VAWSRVFASLLDLELAWSLCFSSLFDLEMASSQGFSGFLAPSGFEVVPELSFLQKRTPVLVFEYRWPEQSTNRLEQRTRTFV